ncbi:MAG: 4-hydroxythreonine-4-phosphate dehydrogenase PdxA [Calothrix sp. SM1_7_51]|nr:4-hydroxythreonine-4-phosphate dehydrogenase PdxA [Calothrix sp. SM1_7_51]
MTKPRLAITQGDPAGIGSEVIFKALANQKFANCCDAVVVGNRDLLIESYNRLSNVDNIACLSNPSKLNIFDVPLDKSLKDRIVAGIGNAASGAASFAFLETAIARTVEGDFDAIVTAPIAKSAWKAAGYDYPGQTELLAQKSGANSVGMLFVGRSPYSGWTLRAMLATTHIPLSQVPLVLTPNLMTQKLDLLVDCLRQDFGLATAKIVVAGLNPHSGEQGQLGSEEQEWLIPWLEKERLLRPQLQLFGPVPPDTMWVKPAQAWYGNTLIQNPADAYLALYHDQGLIPVKVMAFDRAVNTSIGLSFVRTSPDHGTAFDITDKGIADATSMEAAIELAVELVRQRNISKFKEN